MTDRCDQWLIKPARLAAVTSEIIRFLRSFDQFTSDINSRISTMVKKKKKKNNDNAINLPLTGGRTCTPQKRFHIVWKNERKTDQFFFQKGVACSKIKREFLARDSPLCISYRRMIFFFLFLFFLSNQLCTCVYYLYIDSMMLFCGALHVSIGLCMSYRAS